MFTTLLYYITCIREQENYDTPCTFYDLIVLLQKILMQQNDLLTRKS